MKWATDGLFEINNNQKMSDERSIYEIRYNFRFFLY